jgi:hypothetical protein
VEEKREAKALRPICEIFCEWGTLDGSCKCKGAPEKRDE